MKIFKLSTLATALFAAAMLTFPSQPARAGGEGFSKDTLGDSKETIDTKSDLGLGKFQTNPWHITVSVRGGYDDNVNLTHFDPQESFFTNLAVGFTYDFGSPRTRISLNANAGFTYYFDRTDNGVGNGTEDNFDVNTSFSLTITHKATPRLTLGASFYATYQTQPDFQTFTNSNIGFSRQNQNYFYTVNKFSVGYAWTPRFSTVTSYTLGYTNYDDDIVSQFEDRFEHTIGNEFRFLVLPTTTLVAEYRFGFVDYTEVDFRNSTSHYLLGGIDHSFSPRFNISARGGVEFRNYDNDTVNQFNSNQGDNTSPYAELTLNYAIAKSTSVVWSNRYSLEESDVPEFLNRQTYRTSVALRHNWTARIASALTVAYQHDEYDANDLFSGFSEDSFDIALSVRYAITRNWSVEAGYNHTEVNSDENLFRDYSRNRYYAGVTFLW